MKGNKDLRFAVKYQNLEESVSPFYWDPCGGGAVSEKGKKKENTLNDNELANKKENPRHCLAKMQTYLPQAQ